MDAVPQRFGKLMMSSTSPRVVLISADLDALAQGMPIVDGTFKPYKLFEGPGFRVRQLAFDAGAILGEHSAPDPILVQVAEGSVGFEVDGSTYELGRGSILHVAANVTHALTARERSRVIVTVVG